MKLRGVFITLFLMPLVWGVISLLRAGSSYGIPDCPGIITGRDGEDHPAPMRRSDTCSLYDDLTRGSTGTSTYDQLKSAQVGKRHGLYRQGLALTLYAATGTGLVFATTWKPRKAERLELTAGGARGGEHGEA